jgi:probable phosphomutase (TIGR03848 family)
MATFYLIRHGLNDFVDRAIAGWTPGVSLNDAGREQAGRLAWKLLGRGITRVYSSPLERALETARPIAEALGLKVEVRDALGEIRFGEWTGKRFDDLQRDPRWDLFNRYRSGTRPPGGELMLEAQVRIVNELECLRARYPDATMAVVSHSDIIRAALVHYAGMPIDLYARLAMDPGSFSIVALEPEGPRILALNVAAD